MVKKSLQEVIRQNQELGFDPAIIQIAYSNVKGDSTRIIDQIFRLQSQSTAYPVKPSNQQDEQAQLSKAIEMSITEAKDKKISLEPLNPQQRVRKSGVPVGLKNIGNTCYFNSLLQTYFQNVEFVKEILKYEIPQKYQLTKEQIEKHSQQNFQFKRKIASCKLVNNLKVLFAQMIGSDRKYIDPTPVLTSIVDDYGNELPIGDQKDIGEFNLIFLSRIDEGLTEGQQQRKMEIEEDNKMEDSPSKLKVLGGSTDDLNDQQFPTHSLLKHSSITLNTQSIVSRQFIGKISTSFHNEQQNLNKLEQQLFSLLFVNVKNKQLYQALEQVVISRIDDYRNDKGQVVGVQKRTWIKQAPKTLFFQIDRVGFDKEKGQLTKNNEPFDFPKQFYIDPFLERNKQKALQIQFKVKKLRQQRQRYIEYLNQLQSYGKEKQSILKNLQVTMEFFKSQTNKMQLEQGSLNQQQPLVFPNLQKRITPQLINTLECYHQQIEKKSNYYKERIHSIEQDIEKCYQSIRTQPYVLYSILIHEGSAQMGHYYSYVYDIETKLWRKYNDINISEQAQPQVLKQAKGVNTTSAYYLVYAQSDVLTSQKASISTKNYSISSDNTYLKDLYSQFLSTKLKEQIVQQNHQMYYEIEQWKMGSFASRVIDSYTKKFEICNEAFRKNKPEKKKNTPPLLINYPLYLKFIDENLYKEALIQHCCEQYGPKEYSPAFDQILNKKLSNFNQHKRPKHLRVQNDKYNITVFMEQVYKAIAAKMVFNALKEESFSKIIVLLRSLLSDPPGTYFNWLGTLLSKILVVHLLIIAQETVSKSEEQALNKLKLLTFILFKFINLQQEKILHSNCIFWLTQLTLLFKQESKKVQCDRLNDMISQKKYSEEMIEEKNYMANQAEDPMAQIRSMVEILDAAWNLSRTQDVFVNQMIAAREQVKQKIESANEMYRQMKKFNIPLDKSVRDRFINKKK